MSVPADVFTADEIARAAGVPRDLVTGVLALRTAQPSPRPEFLTVSEAIRVGLEARRAARTLTGAPSEPASTLLDSGQNTPVPRRSGLRVLASSFIHMSVMLGMLGLTAGPSETASSPDPAPRLVFLSRPGPGGGGGGGGLRSPLPPSRAEARAPLRRSSVVDASPNRTKETVQRKPVEPRPSVTPRPPEPPAEPLASRRIVAPVVASAASPRQREGTTDLARHDELSRGRGTNGGTGTGRGLGDGEGAGAGIGAGSGGGTGGGPYRAGSGVTPPRLLREVKALYTDDARRLGITGNVILEIVVTRDGSVGEVSVRRGLGAGLDQRAIEAVRQWTFAPAQRTGTPVDVIVEVAVEFRLR